MKIDKTTLAIKHICPAALNWFFHTKFVHDEFYAGASAVKRLAINKKDFILLYKIDGTYL